MGFTTGFTGGVTLSLSLAYLTVLAHQRNRERQGAILRANAYVLDTLSASPQAPAPVPPPTRAELAALQRANFVETAKDRWNAEVEGAVRWAQTKEWAEVREDLEDVAGRLWGRAFGSSPGEEVERAGQKIGDKSAETAQVTRAQVGEATSGVSAAARSALEESKAKSASAASIAGEKAVEAKTSAKGAVQRGIDKGKEMVGKAKAVVGLAEEKLESKTEAAILGMSDVEKALHQRFEKSDVMKKSVEETLNERYTPISQRDNTKLRGL